MASPGTTITERALAKTVHSWPCAFNNFSTVSSTVSTPVYSKPFQVGKYEFRIRLYPGGAHGYEEYVGVFLELCKPSKAKFTCSLSVLVDSERHFEKKSSLDLDVKQNSCKGWNNFVKRTTLFAEVLEFADDQLVFLAEFYDLELDSSRSLYQLEKMCSYEKFINNEEHSDVRIIVGDQTIFAHKVILISGNDVFTAMFSHNLKESKESVINIEDIEFEVILELFRFIYTGQVRNIEKMPKKLLIAADKYGVDDLKIHCGMYLCQLLSVKNVLNYFNFADQYNVHELRKQALAFFITHKSNVAKTSGFRNALKMMDEDSIVDIVTALC